MNVGLFAGIEIVFEFNSHALFCFQISGNFKDSTILDELAHLR